MRILLTADPELPVPPVLYGGIERIVAMLVEGLVEKGFEVGLVAHAESTAHADRFFAWPGRKSQQPLDTLRNTATLHSAVKAFRPDLVHSFSRLLYALPLLTTRLPKIMSYQRPPGARQVAWASRLSRRSLMFTGCSEHICEQGRKGGGTWHTVHNCVDVDRYTFQPSVAADAPLVFLSRVERIKGAHIAIRIAQEARRRLVIAGNHGTGGEEGRYWREEILPHLEPGRVDYVGPVDDTQKNALLGSAAALVVPVLWDEPFGIVFAEALACGTPVISYPRGALPEIVRDGVEGFLAVDLADACATVKNLPMIQRSSCRARAQQLFSMPVMVEKYERLYRDHASVGSSGEA